MSMGWREACYEYFRNCDDTQGVEYILAVHESRWDEFINETYLVNTMPDWGVTKVVRNEGRDCVVDQLNCAAQFADKSSLVLMAMTDDMFPPKDWFSKVEDSFPSFTEPLVVQYSSGGTRDDELSIAGAMTRQWYEKVGYILYPEYTSLYADNDLTATALAAGVLHKSHNVAFDHHHPMHNNMPWDEVYENQNSLLNNIIGSRLFAKRRAAGFPLLNV